MSATGIGVVHIVLMLALIAVRVPIGIAMLVSGGLGYAAISGWWPLLSYVKTAPFFQLSAESFSVIPLFLMMGHLASRSGVSRNLFAAANAVAGHMRGGLAIAAIGACAMFGAICGSSLATAATMGQVALPEMKRYRYSGWLSTGTLAAGGTLGILIPPSIVLVVYAILTEQNISKLFLAAFLPGLLAALGYVLTIMVVVRLRPDAGPAGERAERPARIRALVNIWPVVILFVLVLGGIYGGVFTPTEAASFGVVGLLLIAAIRGGLGFTGLRDALVETALTTGMIFLILIGADIFNAFMALSHIPQALSAAIVSAGLPPYAVLVGFLPIYLLLGCLMDSLSMILLTMPIYFPVIMALDFGMGAEDKAIWFGILALSMVEIGLITPPVGMNVFVINKIAGDVPIAQTFRGVFPFLMSDAVRVTLIVIFAQLTYGILHLWR